MLKQRWPGIYVPAIPDKKLVGNKDEQIVEDRRLLLESFMKDAAKFDYIINSREFKIFSRGPGEIDQVLKSLQRQTPEQVLNKYRRNFHIDNYDAKMENLNLYQNEIAKFMIFVNKAIPLTLDKKEYMKRMSKTRNDLDKAQR